MQTVAGRLKSSMAAGNGEGYMPVNGQSGNLFENLPDVPAEELMESLAEYSGVRVERIVSHGHASPEGFWYDQTEDEWVVLLRGSAILRFRDPDEVLSLQPGDWVSIPAHRRHRVDATATDEPTFWLAVFSSRRQKPA